MTSRFHALTLLALFLAWPLPLAAQTSDPGSGQGTTGGQGADGGEGTPLTRPFRGLFGLGDSGRTGVDVSGSLFGAYDQNLGGTLSTPQVIDSRFLQSGWYTGAHTRLSFNWRGERLSVNGWGSAAGSYYPDFPDPVIPSYSGGVGFSRPLGERNSIRAAQIVAYSPYFASAFLPDLPTVDEPPVTPIDFDPGLTVDDDMVLHSSSTVGLSRQLSRQSSVSLGYVYDRTRFSDGSRRYTQQHGNIGFRRRLTRHATLKLGYGYRAVDTTQRVDLLLDDVTQHRGMHDLDLGVDYSRSLSLTMSRRTQVSFSTGSSFVTGSNLSAGDISGRSRTRFFVTGSARLAHEMGRTWNFSLAYVRSAGISDLILEFITSDAVRASLTGLIGRRNEISVSASALRGHAGIDRANNDLANYMGGVQWRRALTRNLAAQVGYHFYKHEYGNAVHLPFGYPALTDRQGVKFALNVWLPLH